MLQRLVYLFIFSLLASCGGEKTNSSNELPSAFPDSSVPESYVGIWKKEGCFTAPAGTEHPSYQIKIDIKKDGHVLKTQTNYTQAECTGKTSLSITKNTFKIVGQTTSTICGNNRQGLIDKVDLLFESFHIDGYNETRKSRIESGSKPEWMDEYQVFCLDSSKLYEGKIQGQYSAVSDETRPLDVSLRSPYIKAKNH